MDEGGILFGGENRNVYIGCLSCSELEPDSIKNPLGEFGSNLMPNSIWNELGQYGSDLSDYSPWNPLAQNPPIVVDSDGYTYGFFTVNELLPNRTTLPSLLKVLDAYKPER